MMKFIRGILVVSVIALMGGLSFTYLPPTAYTWAPGTPNYNPLAVVHPGTIDTSSFTFGDFVGIAAGQPNAIFHGDSGVSVNWDDTWVGNVGHPNTNGDALDGLWAQIYTSGGWWDLGGQASAVAVFTSQDHGPYLAEGLEYRVYGSNTLWGAVSPQAMATDVYLDGWRGHNPAEDANANGWCSDDIAGVYQLPGSFRYVKLIAWVPTGSLNEPEVDAVAAVDLCDPDPRTQGYWHRQCLGVPADPDNPAAGGIDPGRNGRGPQEPTYPEFEKDLMPAVGLELEELVFEMGGACAAGMDADPPSDPCEKALKQYTALLFNRASDLLQNSCLVDLSAYGCESTYVYDLVGELAALINTGDADSCRVAADCAGAVNEGYALTEAATVEQAVHEAPPVETTTEVAAPVASGGGSPAVVESETVATIEPTAVPDEFITLVTMPVDEMETMDVPIATQDDVTVIRRHLAVVTSSSAPDRARAISRDALLTVLSGGYDLELRLEVVRRLLFRVDTAFESLLAAHLEDIRSEARDFGEEDLAREAELLLKRLEN
jgi:hypothetical protein